MSAFLATLLEKMRLELEVRHCDDFLKALSVVERVNARAQILKDTDDAPPTASKDQRSPRDS